MTIKVKEKKQIKDPKDIARVLQNVLTAEEENDQMKEHLWSIGLNARSVIQYIELVSLGGLDFTVAHPRNVFRFAIQKNVNSLIVAHNHPSENAKPSEEDKEITGRLCDAGEILGIKVMDHIIITRNSCYSFSEHKLIKK